jgi:hypothetical protein
MLSSPAIGLALLTAALHLWANGSYGYFRDELYFIVCGQRPDWGYVDQPPLVPLLAAFMHTLFPNSLTMLRLIPVLAHAATVVLTAETARNSAAGTGPNCSPVSRRRSAGSCLLSERFSSRTRCKRLPGCSVPMHSSASSATRMNDGGSDRSSGRFGAYYQIHNRLLDRCPVAWPTTDVGTRLSRRSRAL